VARKAKIQLALLVVAVIAGLIISNFSYFLTLGILEGAKSVFTEDSEVLVDDSGIPIVDYGTVDGTRIGKQRNPVVVCQQAMDYWEELQERGDPADRRRFLNCANWLCDNAVPMEGYLMLEYDYPLWAYGLEGINGSGMAQGLALPVLSRAAEISSERDYLGTAEGLMGAFYVEEEDGGVTHKYEGDGWWYEEYATRSGPHPRVLNGMIYAMLGLYDYYERTGSARAKFLFDKGAEAAQRDLPDYDQGGHSLYDAMGLPASRMYHNTHVRQLEQLYEITGEELFNAYAVRWKGHMERTMIQRLLDGPGTRDLAVLLLSIVAVFLLLEIFYLLIAAFRKADKEKGPPSGEDVSSPCNGP